MAQAYPQIKSAAAADDVGVVVSFDCKAPGARGDVHQPRRTAPVTSTIIHFLPEPAGGLYRPARRQQGLRLAAKHELYNTDSEPLRADMRTAFECMSEEEPERNAHQPGSAPVRNGEAGEGLRDQCNDFLQQLPAGTLETLAAKWFAEDADARTLLDVAGPKAENGTLRLATESGRAPFEYVRDGGVVGYDMELAAMFRDYAGCGIEIVDRNPVAISPAVQAGKADSTAAASASCRNAPGLPAP